MFDSEDMYIEITKDTTRKPDGFFRLFFCQVARGSNSIACKGGCTEAFLLDTLRGKFMHFVMMYIDEHNLDLVKDWIWWFWSRFKCMR